ncbi:hypothetical protein IAQ61_005902 [Plenodomus lingam]|uniref:Predicted protein n=1 Tax=Leptosphaeria maculans (strain JN3 / isolate v23.1.3 / race Av1-4-5-6-7-8) TaxID=985895 RepID=E4ZLP9_LEPMJ|nr:predicted protein [Plenodomus lingam JN3]KAH9870427.1 hypothetical protein IAQ61_005902 [Plenodomus lingam]CBX92729.1 predicted protein [Plenodomus lingam JN3]
MRSSIFVSAAAFALASAQTPDSFPQTAYLTQTNSLGVVTGGPAVVTAIPSQPAPDTSIPAQPPVVTSQPIPDNIPAVGTGLHTLILPGTGSAFNQTRTVTVSANNSTTIILTPSTTSSGPDATGSGASGSGATRSGAQTGSQTGSGATASATGAAARNFNAAAGGILGFGAFMAAFL